MCGNLTATLETAANLELSLHATPVLMPPLLHDSTTPANSGRAAFDRQLDDWAKMALCMNAINRSLGMPDPYPFVLSESIHDKLYFIHRVVALKQVAQS